MGDTLTGVGVKVGSTLLTLASVGESTIVGVHVGMDIVSAVVVLFRAAPSTAGASIVGSAALTVAVGAATVGGGATVGGTVGRAVGGTGVATAMVGVADGSGNVVY
jgi:hypothetical protein